MSEMRHRPLGKLMEWWRACARNLSLTTGRGGVSATRGARGLPGLTTGRLALAAGVLFLAPGCGSPADRWVATSRDGVVEVSQAFAGESVNGETAALYFALRNRGREDDALEAIVIDGAGSTRIHTSGGRNGLRVMSALTSLDLPAKKVTRLVPGGTHVMLLDLARRPAAGDSISGVLRFRSGREVSLRAEVRGLTDLEDVVAFGTRLNAG